MLAGRIWRRIAVTGRTRKPTWPGVHRRPRATPAAAATS